LQPNSHWLGTQGVPQRALLQSSADAHSSSVTNAVRSSLQTWNSAPLHRLSPGLQMRRGPQTVPLHSPAPPLQVLPVRATRWHAPLIEQLSVVHSLSSSQCATSVHSTQEGSRRPSQKPELPF
jgi:hypothetical protein